MIQLRLSAALGLAVCGLAAAAGPAAAANVFVDTDIQSVNTLRYADFANQDNHVTLSNGHPAGLLLEDAFEVIAGQGCTPTPSFSLSATCRPTNGRPLQRYAFSLNVGNDYLDLRQATLAGDAGVLNGGPGADSVFAGAGDDTINVAGDGTADSYGCGGGFDVVNADLVDHHALLADLNFSVPGRISSNCEVVNAAPVGEQPTVGLPRVLRARHGNATVRVACPATHDGGPCSGTLTLARVLRGNPGAEHTATLGSAAFHMALGKSRTLRIAVGRASGPVQATATEHDSQGRPKTTTSQLVLR
jgi:hypothetical protein